MRQRRKHKNQQMNWRKIMALGTICNQLKTVARRTMLVGLGVTAVVVENLRQAADNAGPYTEKLVERGQQASEGIGEAYEQRRQDIRHRVQANGTAKG
jgi:hypothetical protein